MSASDVQLVKQSTSEALEGLVAWARNAGHSAHHLKSGDLLMREGEQNPYLYILLEGEIELSKKGPDGKSQVLDLLGPGSLIGILSFWTGNPSFSDSCAKRDVEYLKVGRRLFDQTVGEDAEFSRITLQLLVANLSDRYRRVVGLNLKVAGLTRELEHERNALQAAVTDLKQTRNQMVHREKLATMGQLLAGIAHEINNPSTSLMQSVARLGGDLPELLQDRPEELRLLEAGRHAPFVSTSESREKMAVLEQNYPGLSRARARRLIRFPENLLEDVHRDLKKERWQKVDAKIRLFEMGSSLHSIQIANDRIARLVKSLKSYSRQDESESAGIDLEQCIQDTLMVLNHVLKHYDLSLEIPAMSKVPGKAGEINQILTNLLTNACEATEPGKKITIRGGMDESGAWLEVEDEGPGIPEELMEKIFEPNVTTKSGGGQYGLGLGLAISHDLAMQHQGKLYAYNREEAGGAVFRLELPRGL
ncbi:ATP-binding protein [Kiritimatiellaeota bacterium B1221]|nr:ATP-binding protein [Kiritimatiellaeota bacterium B1221]